MMRSPWLDIPLGDYQAHMALPAIGQLQLIADQLNILVRTYAPSSVAIRIGIMIDDGNSIARSYLAYYPIPAP